MAWNLRLLSIRHKRLYFSFCLSFLLGLVLGSLLFCSSKESKLLQTPLADVKEEDTGATSQPKQKELISTPLPQDDEAATEIQLTTAEKPTVELEPYPPLLDKKGFILTPQDCPKDLFLLIIVVTSSRNFEARKAIRKSWGEDTSKKNESAAESFRVVYIVGSDNENDRLIKREAKRYKDVLRGGFKDIYRKNEDHSVKILLGLKWATTSCKAKFILKTSSESFVNTAEIISVLSKKDSDDLSEGLYMGFCHGANLGGANVVRNIKSPWYISEDEWPDKRLPPYASGMGITLSYDVAEKIIDLSVKEKLIHIDDVYIGIMAKKLSIPCTDESTKYDTSYTTMLTECEDRNFCVLGGVPAKDMYYLSQNIRNLKDIC